MGGQGPLGVKLGGMQMNGVASPLMESEKDGHGSGRQDTCEALHLVIASKTRLFLICLVWITEANPVCTFHWMELSPSKKSLG